MILVITHTSPKTIYDHRGRLEEEKGDIYVSHGVDIHTGKNVVLPCDLWKYFSVNCFHQDGEWYLKG